MGGTRIGRCLVLSLVAILAVTGLPGPADAQELPEGPVAAGAVAPAAVDFTGWTPLTGDFTGDGHQDLFLFGAGTADDVLWDIDTWSNTLLCEGWSTPPSSNYHLTINSDATPVVGDFTGDNVDDIFWYAPGAAVDRLWDFNHPIYGHYNYTATSFSVGGTTFRPVAGDLSADGVDDLIWYAPGAAGDIIWDFNTGGTFTRRSLNVNGTYRPIVGRFSPDSKDDIFWYAPGSGAESMWSYWDSTFRPLIANSSVLQVTGTYLTAVTDTWGEGREDIVFATPFHAPDHLWDFKGNWDLIKEDLPNGTAFGTNSADSFFTHVVSLNFATNSYGDLLFWNDVGRTTETFNSDAAGGHRTIFSCVF